MAPGVKGMDNNSDDDRTSSCEYEDDPSEHESAPSPPYTAYEDDAETDTDVADDADNSTRRSLEDQNPNSRPSSQNDLRPKRFSSLRVERHISPPHDPPPPPRYAAPSVEVDVVGDDEESRDSQRSTRRGRSDENVKPSLVPGEDIIRIVETREFIPSHRLTSAQQKRRNDELQRRADRNKGSMLEHTVTQRSILNERPLPGSVSTSERVTVRNPEVLYPSEAYPRSGSWNRSRSRSRSRSRQDSFRKNVAFRPASPRYEGQVVFPTPTRGRLAEHVVPLHTMPVSPGHDYSTYGLTSDPASVYDSRREHSRLNEYIPQPGAADFNEAFVHSHGLRQPQKAVQVELSMADCFSHFLSTELGEHDSIWNLVVLAGYPTRDTGSNGGIWATTCGEYVEHTWPQARNDIKELFCGLEKDYEISRSTALILPLSRDLSVSCLHHLNQEKHLQLHLNLDGPAGKLGDIINGSYRHSL